MVEQPAVNRRVVGSNPTCGAKRSSMAFFSDMVASRRVRTSPLSYQLTQLLAPQVGFEPTTRRLTAGCSTTELLRSVAALDTAASVIFTD